MLCYQFKLFLMRSHTTAFSKGVGASFNDCHCEFPGDLEPEHGLIEGIQFSLYEQEVVISNSKFLQYLKNICDIFIEDNPQEKVNIEHLLNTLDTRMEFTP